MADVNWTFLQRALDFYRANGFRYIELPWAIPADYAMITCPKEEFLVHSSFGALVGSAEQAFICLDHEGRLPPDRYVACTPCFRNEVVEDQWHQKHFMKVELYCNEGSSDRYLVNVARDCMETMADGALLRACFLTEPQFDDGTFDLEMELGNGRRVEVGSYGERRNFKLAAPKPEIRWAYGTGLAEPRFSSALKTRKSVLAEAGTSQNS